MTAGIIGWDVGGAHLKAVLLAQSGQVLAAYQVFCPLWRGLHVLETAIDKILLEFNAEQHALTMTGELADIFPNRCTGVQQIAATISAKLHGSVRFFAGQYGFVVHDNVKQYWAHIASMNWYASVNCVAHNVERALFVDIGSTTTDIALIENGVPRTQGFTDAARMQCDELVYTGVVRTPLMALAQKITFAGKITNVAAEYFATTADVYTLTGDLDPAENMAETADGAAKTIEASACRIARMVGCDAADAPLNSWIELAHAFKNVQLEQIRQAVKQQMRLLDDHSDLKLIGAGAGAFLAAEIASQLALEYQPVSAMMHATDQQVLDKALVCFPAYAVACLGLNDAGVNA